MKTYKAETQTREVKTLASHTCDRCGASLFEGIYEIAEVEINSRTGEAYPEGSHGTEISFDCCCRCFTENVVPALEKLGFKSTGEDFDY
jgi:hypothetical protein